MVKNRSMELVVIWGQNNKWLKHRAIKTQATEIETHGDQTHRDQNWQRTNFNTLELLFLECTQAHPNYLYLIHLLPSWTSSSPKSLPNIHFQHCHEIPNLHPNFGLISNQFEKEKKWHQWNTHPRGYISSLASFICTFWDIVYFLCWISNFSDPNSMHILPWQTNLTNSSLVHCPWHK